MINRHYLESIFPLAHEFFSRVGLTEEYFVAYVTLCLQGKMKASDLSVAVNVDRVRIYKILKKLQKYSAVDQVGGKPAVYSAAPLEKFVNNVIFRQESEVNSLKSDGDRLLKAFEKSLKSNSLGSSERISFRFRLIEDETTLIHSTLQMISQTKHQLRIAFDKCTFFRFCNASLLPLIAKCIEKNVAVRMVFENNEEIRKIVGQTVAGRSVKYSNIKSYPVFMISDSNEIMSLIEAGENGKNTEPQIPTLGFWCNSSSYICKMSSLFDHIYDQAGQE